MPVHISSKFCSARCSLTAGLVMLAFSTGFEMSDLIAQPDDFSSGQTVNRTLKSDRLPPAPAFHPNVINQFSEAPPRQTNVNSKLPVGCEALVSPIASPRLARIAGRCVS